ncbi:MAG: GNAT family N-acetyltransferase, partial [Chloroflexota bacterium]
TIRIAPFDFKHASAHEYAAANVFFNRVRAEQLPDDPPTPLDENIRNWQSIPPFVFIEAWGAWNADGSEVVAAGSVNYLLTDENQHLAQFEIDVLPSFRRQGIGKQLLAVIADVPRREGRRLMVTGTSERVRAGEAFMQRLGARKGLANHTNQLDLADVDRDLVRRWIAQAHERAADFELGFWDGPFPEPDIYAIADLYDVMNSMPHDDLEVEDYHFTPEQVRQMERGMFARGTERWALYLREKATGKFAGFSDVYWHANRPEILQQGNTGVLPQYRNKGLGRWLKAAMIEKVLRERPQVKRIRTGNADSNAPMLKINYELGFKPYISQTVWQVETEQVLAYLASGGRETEDK